MRLLVIDNYDSFTWNLVHYLQVAGAEVDVARNDAMTADDAVANWDALVISPGPGMPDDAGISLSVVAACVEHEVPLLGVCLGHQAIAQSLGGHIGRAANIMHGKTSQITHDGTGLFADLPSPFSAARYHSLTVVSDSLPACLEVTARSEDGTIMGISHRTSPIHGIQFHPESVASDHGAALLKSFLTLAGSR